MFPSTLRGRGRTLHHGVIGLLCTAMLLTGCYRWHRTDVDELVKLDGWKRGDEVPLRDLRGKWFQFDGEMYLTFLPHGSVLMDSSVRYPSGGGPVQGTHRYASIEVREGVFYGQARTSDAGGLVKVMLDDIAEVICSNSPPPPYVVVAQKSQRWKFHVIIWVTLGVALAVLIYFAAAEANRLNEASLDND